MKNYAMYNQILADLHRISFINEALRGELFEHDQKASAEASLFRADTRGALVTRNSLVYRVCQKIGYLNSVEKQETGEFILRRRYNFGDMKISQVNMDEAASMIYDFLSKKLSSIVNEYDLGWNMADDFR